MLYPRLRRAEGGALQHTHPSGVATRRCTYCSCQESPSGVPEAANERQLQAGCFLSWVVTHLHPPRQGNSSECSISKHARRQEGEDLNAAVGKWGLAKTNCD
eukprot:TRINITY_DN1672_c0_g1_i1.p2 TRINITY_DN1672_c0_g1~~TRINITY_DN1672_c0_g1_i1.p2  ORF type:complete len:102 (-),score=1.47 TRINITY_DN1672_c0_g1_i1:321-626(-)